MTYQEIIEKIKERGGINELGNREYRPEEIELKLVHSVGGKAGAGEYAERVFEHDNNGEKIYLKLTGYYSSYDGSEWEKIVEATPEQQMITVYKNK